MVRMIGRRRRESEESRQARGEPENAAAVGETADGVEIVDVDEAADGVEATDGVDGVSGEPVEEPGVPVGEGSAGELTAARAEQAPGATAAGGTAFPGAATPDEGPTDEGPTAEGPTDGDGSDPPERATTGDDSGPVIRTDVAELAGGGRHLDSGSANLPDGADGRGVSTFRPLPRVIAVANQKGGVGKTTTTVNLGAALAELGYRILVVDLDPQGNATTGLGIDARNFEYSMYDVIMRDTPLEDCIEPTSVRNLFVAPATIDLAGVEIELVPAFSRELRLRRAVQTVLEDFDFVLIDCPPSLGLITINGLAAASEVLVPIQCEYYALEGLGQLLRNVHLVASNLNDRLEVSAIVLTMYDARTRLALEVAAEVRQHFGDKVCRIVIPRTVRLSEAPSFGQPITVFDPASRGAVAYRELAKEVSNGASQRTG